MSSMQGCSRKFPSLKTFNGIYGYSYWGNSPPPLLRLESCTGVPLPEKCILPSNQYIHSCKLYLFYFLPRYCAISRAATQTFLLAFSKICLKFLQIKLILSKRHVFTTWRKVAKISKWKLR